MKKLITVLAAITLSLNVYAGSVCPSIEFAELQIYSDTELRELATGYILKAADLSPNRSPVAQVEYENCMAQNARVYRIQKGRFDAKNAQPAQAPK